MENKISPLIVSQISDYLQSSAPLFVSFLETYYKYLQQRTNAVGLVQNRHLDSDIDNTLDVYISEFYAVYGEYLPTQMAIDKRNFVKLLNSVYAAKGTEKALKLIFQALFNEPINITYPSEQILLASGGEWESESFISLVTQFGIIPTDTPTLSVSNGFGEYLIEITKVDVMSSTTARFYFNTVNKIELVDNQIIYYYIDGVMTYAGGLIKSANKLVVSNPGQKWQIGQVVTIPGSTRNTVARVTNIKPNGGVISAEILEYGYEHEPNQIVTISPYSHKPLGSIVDITTEIISYNPTVFKYTVNISDFTDGASETIIGVSDGYDENSYFLEDYVIVGYSGQIVIAQSIQSILSGVNTPQDNGITITEWLDSRATFLYNYSNIVRVKGGYKNDRGLISNQEARMQDNYFYQAFSYLVETTKDLREYNSVLNITHPAGTKLFANIIKTTNFDLGLSSQSIRSHDVMRHLEIIDVVDKLSFSATKSIESYIDTPIDSIQNLNFDKVLASTITPTSTILSIFSEKLLNDSSIINDILQIDARKTLLDSFIVDDTASKNFTKSSVNDFVIINEAISFNPNKYLDSTTVLNEYILDKIFDKKLSDVVSMSDDDISSFNIDKNLVDVSVINDILSKIFIKYNITDNVTAFDVASKTTDKYLNSTVTMVSNDTSTIEIVSYSESGYFSENYAELQYTLQIG